MDIKVIFYILILVVYYVYKFIKKQQAGRPVAENDVKTIKPVFESDRPVAVKPVKQQDRTASLENLFSEFVKGPTPVEVYEKPKEAIHTDKRGENTATYENPITKIQVETSIDRGNYVGSIKKAGKNSRFEEVSSVKRSKKNFNLVFNKSELKRAFIYSEIFKTKF